MKFNNTIAYRTPAHVSNWLREQSGLAHNDDHPLVGHVHRDPKGSARSDCGLTQVDGESILVELNGSGVLMAVQFNERILPSNVRNEYVERLIAEVEQQTGRRPGKKEIAELRDRAEATLLPVSHIKRTVVPVIVSNDGLMLVFTSSMRRADDVLSVLWAVVPEMDAAMITAKGDVPGALTCIARDLDEEFTPASGGLLRGENGETFRVKDVAIERHDVQDMLDGGYIVHDLDVTLTDDGAELASFNLNEKLVIRRLKIDGTLRKEAKGDAKKMDVMTDAWLTLKVATTLLQRLMPVVGGEVMIDFAKDDEL